jgi:hypothetical protein
MQSERDEIASDDTYDSDEIDETGESDASDESVENKRGKYILLDNFINFLAGNLLCRYSKYQEKTSISKIP